MNHRLWGWGLLLALALVLFLAPFASSLPDGLEWTAQTLGFARRESPLISAPLPDYRVSGVPHERLSTALAGALGTLLLFGIGRLLGQWLRSKGQAR